MICASSNVVIRVYTYVRFCYDLLMRRRINLYVDLDLLDGLKTLKERDGVSESEQIRRGIRLWLDAKGINPRRRAARKGGRLKK